MKAVILAGGYGSRISEESIFRPKPMIEVGEKPIIWHIMKIYSSYGINDFIICLGYKSEILKQYFLNYNYFNSNFEINIQSKKIRLLDTEIRENWNVSLVDTGLNTMTGGRLKKIKKYLGNDETFCMTYGDGVAKININKLIDHHIKSKKLATMTVVKPGSRFGIPQIKNNYVNKFEEKPSGKGDWINGGFFVLNSKVLNEIKSEKTIWEKEPLQNLIKKKELNAYQLKDFWHPMDTMRDKKLLQDLWDKKKAPWKTW